MVINEKLAQKNAISVALKQLSEAHGCYGQCAGRHLISNQYLQGERKPAI